jgi:retinol dehydrogenase-12
MSRPVVVVTGSSDGIGLETARQLAARGARVILHGRNADKLQVAVAKVRAVADDAVLAAELADLASLAGVRALAERLAERRIDVVVHNAGVFMTARVLTVDGFETTFAVNHLAPFALTHALLAGPHADALRRIVNVSSMVHTSGRIDLDDLDGARRPFDGYGAYAASKLANVLFTAELARRVASRGITVNALHPGVVATQLLRIGFGSHGPDSLEEGARTSVFLALEPSVATVTGGYFVRCRPARAHPLAADATFTARFYQRSAEAVGVPLG